MGNPVLTGIDEFQPANRALKGLSDSGFYDLNMASTADAARLDAKATKRAWQITMRDSKANQSRDDLFA